MSNSSLSGLKLDTYEIHEAVGCGAFGSVYRATNKEKNVVAVKVAHEEPQVGNTAAESGIPSLALALFSGGYNKINPVPAKLLEIQCTRSNSAPKLFPHTSGPFQRSKRDYIVMEFIRGLTLRQLLNRNLKAGAFQVNDLDLAIGVFETLSTLQESELGYHGDLKPENIILSGNGVRLIDPGFHGSLPCREGMIPQAVITTPQYYPCLEPEDSFAAGAIFWEICLGRHPLAPLELSSRTHQIGISAPTLSGNLIGPSLKQMLDFQELLGHYFLSPLNNLILPSVLDPLITPQIQDLLLASIGLELAVGGVLEKARKTLPPQDLLAQLLDLKNLGTAVLSPRRHPV